MTGGAGGEVGAEIKTGTRTGAIEEMTGEWRRRRRRRRAAMRTWTSR